MWRKIIFTYASVFISFTLIFIGSFHTPIFSHQTVLFYLGLSLLTLATLIAIVVSLLIYSYIKFPVESFIAALAITIAFHISFFVVFPVTFDRSVTMFLLNNLNSQPTTTSVENLEADLVDHYIKNNQAVSRRINEQSIIKMISVNNNQVNLTSKGKNFLIFSNIIKTLFKISANQ